LLTVIRVRAAQLDDCDAIARIQVTAWRETYRGMIPDSVIEGYSEEKRRRQWRQAIALGKSGPAVFVAIDANDAPIGFGAAGKARDPALKADAEIYAIYVVQSAHGQGAGRALLRALFAAMAARGHRSIGLWVFTGNAAARRFYERIGGVAGLRRDDTSEGWVCDETAYRWDDLRSEPGVPPPTSPEDGGGF
jgi:ribosomal protein S18 acetylase RimI-like enzyme